MIFGRWSLKNGIAATRAFGAAAAAVAVLALSAAGCGGGGGGPAPGPGGGVVTVRGTVSEGVTGTPVGGSVITFGGTRIVTAGDGTFQIDVPAPTSGQQTLTIVGPDSEDPDTNPDYYSTGQFQFNGAGPFVTTNLTVSGIAVPASAAAQTFTVRIRLYSLDGPPPPPTL